MRFVFNLKHSHQYQGSILSLLLLSSLLFKGTNDFSVLLISYSLFLLAMLSFTSFIGTRTHLQLTPITVLLLAWIVWGAMGPALGWVPNSALFGLFQCSLWVIAFCIFDMSTFPEYLWNKLFYLMWVLGVSSALYALWQFFILHAMPCGFFANKNTNAAFLMMTTLILIGDFLSHSYRETTVIGQSKWPTYRTLLVFSMYIMTLSMIAALSRGVAISFLFFVAFELILLRQYISKKCVLQLGGILLFALLPLLILAQPAIEHRWDLLQHEKSRFVIWEGAWHLWQNTPWYGIGIFNFMRYYPAFSLPGDGSNLQYAHNDFLQLLIETGIPGELFLLGIVLTLIISCWLYLQRQHTNAMTHVKIIACFAALGAFAFHSVVDFNFYVLSMNLFLGCCLGYLHTALKEAQIIRIWSIQLSSRLHGITVVIGLIVFLVISTYALQLFMLNYYTTKADTATKRQDFHTAIKNTKNALQWFDFSEVHSREADLYMQLANDASLETERRESTVAAEKAIKAALASNPYYARPYFQMALLQILLLNNQTKAREFFYQSLKNNPHYCLARITFSRFLIEQRELLEAQKILEQGLSYPIPADQAEIYLNYLAKLRFENGDKEGALRVVDRLNHLNYYNSDYSNLLASV